MGESLKNTAIKKKIHSLTDFTWPDISLRRNPSPGLRNRQIYRCVLGCSLNGNSTNRSSRNVKSIKREESRSLVLERR